MSLENTLREMLSEGSPFIKRPGEIKPSPIKPSPKQTPKSTEEKPNPTRSASGPGVDYTPTRKGLKEFYKARLEGALLGETHEMSALEGARREGRLDGIARSIAAGILSGGVAAGGYGVGNLAVDSIMSTDVATHNARVAAGEVMKPKGMTIGQVRATAEPAPQYGAFQRGAIAAREAAREAARAKGKKGK
jgi:hypothetical protein